MNEYYVVYCDDSRIEVNDNGEPTVEDGLYIAEYNEDGKFIRRVNTNNSGKVIEVKMDISVEEMEDLEMICDYSETVKEAIWAYADWLEEQLE